MRDIHGRETWVFGIIVVAALVLGICAAADPRRAPRSRCNAFITSYRDRLQDARRAPEAPPHVYPALPPPRRRRRAPPARRRRRAPAPGGMRRELRFRPALRLHADADPDRAWAASCCSPRPSCAAQAAPGLAWLGVAGCVAALVAVVVQWPDAADGADRTSTAMLVVDRMALYLDGAFIVAGAADAAVRAALPARARLRVRRVLRAGAVRDRRHGDGGARDAPGDAVHRHRDDVARPPTC